MDRSRQFSGLNLSGGKSLQNKQSVPRPNIRLTKLSGRPLITQIHNSLIKFKLAPTLPLLPSTIDTKPHLTARILQNNISADLKPKNTSRASNELKKHTKNKLLLDCKALDTPTFYNGFFNTNDYQDSETVDNIGSLLTTRSKLSLSNPRINSSSHTILNINTLLTPSQRKTSINLSHKRIRVLNPSQARDVFSFNP